MITDTDIKHLERCVQLAGIALDSGNPPFGSVLVDAQGRVRFEGHNETVGGDQTRHPEFAIARWAAANMTPEERSAAVVYTSGEHCPMCAAAHAWVGLGRIVFASSSAQLSAWLSDMNQAQPPVATLPISAVAPGITAEGPYEPLAEQVRQLQAKFLTEA